MDQQLIEVIQQQLARLLARLDGATPVPAGSLDDEVRGELAEFLGLAAAIAPDDWETMQAGNTGLFARQQKLQEIYGQYIKERELAESARLQARTQDANGRGPLALEEFGSRIYQRVDDLFARLDLSSCRCFVMVGCGPLPATLLNVMDSTAIPRIIGVDSDEAAVSAVNDLAESFGLTRLSAVHCDGRSYDYSGADVVYVANLVRQKSAVLGRIADTLGTGARVVLRDPASIGAMLAESGTQDLDPRFVVTGEGEPVTEFWSRHVFMTLDS